MVKGEIEEGRQLRQAVYQCALLDLSSKLMTIIEATPERSCVLFLKIRLISLCLLPAPGYGAAADWADQVMQRASDDI
jgi:hypothetical protein